MKVKISAIIVLFFVVMAAGQYKQSDGRLAPKLLNYQGYLTDLSGNPITNPSVSMTFAIFDAVSAGNQKWSETQSTVSIDKGIFNVLLGSVTPIPDSVFTNGTDRWLQLTVAGQTLSPRTRITSSGYAYTATYSDTAQYSRNAAPDNDWSFLISDGADTTLQTGGRWGLARLGNTLYGNADSTHVNFGGACTTGTSGLNSKYCTVSGGSGNKSGGYYATVAGGLRNNAGDDYATVAGGAVNVASNNYASIGGGLNNTAESTYATVGGGRLNGARGTYATVAGGYSGIAGNSYATVGGGYVNSASGYYATVSGGYNNIADDSSSFMGGGRYNKVRGAYSVVCGGGSAATADSNSAMGKATAIVGGRRNTADSVCSFIGGGYDNTTTGNHATIAGGYINVASGLRATIGGGGYHLASGSYSTIPGGYDNTASGTMSFAGGYKADAAHTGSFVWADSTGSTAFSTTIANQFRVRANGGIDFTGDVGIGTLPAYPLHVVGSGTGIALYSYSVAGRAGYYRIDNNDNYALYAINSTGSGATIQGLYVSGHAYATGGFQTFLSENKTGCAMLSQDGELVLSGSSTLQQGTCAVRFEQGIIDAISSDVQIKVIATPSEECNGVYVTNRSVNGFTVKELMNGRSNAAFDWIAIIRIKGYEKRPVMKSMSSIVPKSGGG